MASAGFVHLHVNSAYSLLRGAMKIAKLAELAKADHQPALALTDTDNMFGALEFSDKMAGSGIQPIVGCALAIDFGDVEPTSRSVLANSHGRLVLLAAREAGYRSLMRLNSRAFLETPVNHAPHIKFDWLHGETEGLIVLTGGPDGPISQAIAADQAGLALARCERLAELFGDRLYVELQRHGLDKERRAEPTLIDIAYDKGLPLVATNEPYFASADDYEAHDALLCIAGGRLIAEAERDQLTPDHRFKTRAEMAVLFADLPEALASTVEIAERCAYRPLTRKPILPRFTVGASSGGDAAAEENAEVRRQAEEGLAARLAAHGMAPGLVEEDYTKRLNFELDVITRMNYSGYFLIVSDFIKWAKSQGIPVGPGRGSGAGSLVAYALTITDLDPMRFALLFERFLNPERVSMPDFDIDFCQDRRDEVIRYVQERYGREQVAQIITFGTLQARGVLRDVGRVLQMPYGQVDKLTKLVPQNPAAPITLAAAIESEPKLQAVRDEDPVVARAFDIAQKLEGLNRHASTHAAGIVIGDRPLSELVPMYRDPKSDMPVTQFNMKWVEPAGLVKFDFLGLKTLTTLDVAVKLLRQRGEIVDLSQLKIDDSESYAMLARGEVVGVFQVESQGMRRALIDMRPDRFEDIVALVALYRPGPMANIPTYCARKHGDEQPEYLHPILEPILKETFGVIIYQEQVMQIAQAMSGYSLGEADLLRRAMGKKIRAEMDKQRVRFVSGAVENGVPKDQADTIFDLLAKFADYGFNKSHAAAYALVSFQTAYMKAHYPVEFLAASMTLEMSNTDKLSEFRAEAQRLNIKVEPPSVNRSGVNFDVRDGKIHYALAALKGVGAQAVQQIVEARGDKPFTSIADFAARVSPRAVNKRVLESLAAAGAFDDLEPNRASVFGGADAILAACQRSHEAVTSGQNDMFGGLADAPSVILPGVEPWLPSERLQREYDAIGFFLSGHPLDDYRTVLKRLNVQSWAEFSQAVKNGRTAGKVAATVVSRMERRTKTGNKMGIIGLSDPSGHFEAVLFSEALGQFRDMLEPGLAVLLQLAAELQGEDVRARINNVELLDQAAAKTSMALRVFVRDTKPLESIAKRLSASEAAPAAASRPPGPGSRPTARAGNGDGEVTLVMMLDLETEVDMKLPGRFKVSPQIAGALKAVPGVVDVQTI
ncbi:DNA polymerase III subunit alpha [Bradyrhizobium sp. U87765 SZCCT0131]|uniref:DNA polymerase III subunit alpha n=1 Tax=unclassified Bradyrhizobium TaxID=2631580 RepID=UPI001BA46516|nr:MULTISPECIES: DNA polymerase III subunit alpha [unclassified Bradyrhizobium]MBR1220033.1 DNA polymerase III subunit alpha [Bradyrhizobium sp. U87765 SZCCT0131]MBR1263511.1 DNA polymerase III subunit alpha [Bradyrhizobium sp. U87765 SZCCT0134]MBR1309080.1 DNA polymerase III subunit alpha [Bradyrhizobium sp. U87765 SZCCT0110]MBR1323843.1 DNA polymerase III subunit alpha [Bradyrhizobium sp. U87765 SZCCT0109]MBR1349395.1 DNA polymerase III subunit alpha [Bradyrhizobium sp. U87765 SZCCT0048]